jgi:hypothetical protein
MAPGSLRFAMRRQDPPSKCRHYVLEEFCASALSSEPSFGLPTQ